jgi:hypothetical protein
MEHFGRSRKARPRAIPITGVSLFIAEKKADAAQSHPQLTKLQLVALLNHQWEALDDATKISYQRKADYARRTLSRRQHKTRNEQKQSRVSPYSIFVRGQHDTLKRTNPELTVGDRAKLIAAEWNNMPQSDKIPYVNAAKRETRKLRKVSTEEESENEGDRDDMSQ